LDTQELLSGAQVIASEDRKKYNPPRTAGTGTGPARGPLPDRRAARYVRYRGARHMTARTHTAHASQAQHDSRARNLYPGPTHAGVGQRRALHRTARSSLDVPCRRRRSRHAPCARSPRRRCPAQGSSALPAPSSPQIRRRCVRKMSSARRKRSRPAATCSTCDCTARGKVGCIPRSEA
jgi:hypothetical protein